MARVTSPEIMRAIMIKIGGPRPMKKKADDIELPARLKKPKNLAMGMRPVTTEQEKVLRNREKIMSKKAASG